jgi:hypothetical protein
MSVVSLVLAPWFARAWGIEVETTSWISDVFHSLFG